MSEVEEIATVNSVQVIESLEYLAGTLLSVLCSCHRFSLFSGGLETFARYRHVLRR